MNLFVLFLFLNITPIYATWMSPIPYFINDSIVHKDRVMEAIEYIQEHTNWEFIQRTNEITYIHFRHSEDGCSAYLGYSSGGPRYSNIGKHCEVGVIIHEICHNLGMPHQQQYSHKPNRSNYVKIQEQNIQDGKESNFYLHYPLSQLQDYAYDYGSIMHYGLWFFSNNGRKTITLNNVNNITSCTIGYFFELSDIDIKKLNALCPNCNNSAKPKKKYEQYCGGLFIKPDGNIFGNYENNKQVWGDHQIRYRWSMLMKNRWEVYQNWYYLYETVRAHSYDGITWYVNEHVDESNYMTQSINDKPYGVHILEIYLYVLFVIFSIYLVSKITKAIFFLMFFIALWFGLKFLFYYK
jgi:hypothetical protein